MRAFLPPVALLVLLACFAAWNAAAITRHTDRCVAEIDAADRFASAEDWPSAIAALSASHTHWQSCRRHLRITITHDMVDAADSMYCRAMAFADTEELTEFRAETAGLRTQLLLLAEAEQFRLENIF